MVTSLDSSVWWTVQILGGGGVQGQGKGQLLIGIFVVNYIWLASCQSKIYEN